jgi:hypothetical protein
MPAGIFQAKWGGLRKILEAKTAKAAAVTAELTTA